MDAIAFNRSGDDRHTAVGGQGTPCVMPSGRAGQCGELGLSSEGYALASSLGESALYIWAIGLLAAGQASTMVCTYAGQIIMGGCLQIQLAPWKRVAFTRAIALVPALLVAVSTGSDTSLFNNINEYLNVLQSVQLPFAMLPVLHFAANKKVMGRFASSPLLFAISGALALLVMAINVILIVEFIQAPPAMNADSDEPEPAPPAAIAIISVLGVGYFAVCARLMGDELRAAAICLMRLCGAGDGLLLRRASQLIDEQQQPRSPFASSAAGGAGVNPAHQTAQAGAAGASQEPRRSPNA